MADPHRYLLNEVFNMQIEVDNGKGVIMRGLSDAFGDALKADDKEGHYLNGAVDALESLILAHACAGINVASPDYQDAVNTALDAIDNNLGD